MEQLRRSVVKPTFKSDTEYITESDELAGIEIKMNKSRVTEDVPIHFRKETTLGPNVDVAESHVSIQD